jgi:hypothetical protein
LSPSRLRSLNFSLDIKSWNTSTRLFSIAWRQKKIMFWAVLWIRTHFFRIRIRIHKLFFSDSDSDTDSDS